MLTRRTALTWFTPLLLASGQAADERVIVVDAGSGQVIKRAGQQISSAPGSAIKPFTAVALIDSGRPITISCPLKLEIGTRSLSCSHPVLARPVDLSSALAYSCNNYFARGSQRLTSTLQRFGLAARSPADDEQARLQAIGEWGVSCTPLQLAQAYRRLALLRKNGKYAAVWEGMEGAVEYGTAQLAAVKDVRVAGKTGTAAGHGWFAGWMPAEEPKYVVAVSVPQGRGGDAAQIASKVFQSLRASGPSGLRVRVYKRGVVTIPIEAYVEGVLAGESSTFQSMEALQAMAVAARTFGIYGRGRHKAEGFDVCDTTHCQDLRPDVKPGARIHKAVAATEGELLWHQGRPIAAFYHRHCGGTTEDVRHVWPEMRAPYLRQLTDTFCVGRGRGEWDSELKRVDIGQIDIVSRTPTGRAGELRAGGVRMSGPVFHQRIGERFGWTILRSNHYNVIDRGDRIIFQGYGAGHGVGLCQIGADERGKAGQGYRDILAFYYPDTKLGVTAQGLSWTSGRGELVEVAATTPQDLGSIATAADRALREAQARMGMEARSPPGVRAYPSVAAYRDATGEPGFIAASSRNGIVRLQPVGVLRSSGRLESTLLHEMLHVLIDDHAAPSVPLWFREGLVLYLSAPGSGSASGSVADSSFTQPRSEAEMRAAYRTARARVQGLIGRYGRSTVLGWIKSGLPTKP